MDSQEIPPMSPQFSGPAGPIPSRTSSKRTLKDMTIHQLETKKSDLGCLIKKRRMDLKPSSSFDSEYWSSHLEVLEMEKELHECTSLMAFRGHTEGSNSHLTYNEWLRSVDMGLELGRKRSAIDLKLSAAKSQSTRLSKQHPLLESWVKLFFGAASGFGLGAASFGRRSSQEQSKMRAEMMDKYHEGESQEKKKDKIWEPVCGAWLRSEWVHAAHLYPAKSIEHMDIIFGEGAKKELMTASNGLFLCPDIEKALELGYIAIVPDVRLEPDVNEDPNTDMINRRQHVKDWENSDPKEYKLIVLENSKSLRKRLSTVFEFSSVYNIQSVKDLDGRRLTFRTNFRPRARFMWWTYLNAVVNLSYRNKPTRGIGVDKEVELGNRYWGTRGKYVKRNQLLGFVEHLGQDVASISSTLVLEHGIKEEGEEELPNATAVVVVANTTIRKASSNLSNLGIGGDSDEEDDGDEDEGDEGEEDEGDEEEETE
ncbi:uncharacterized protein GGS22DRAFT_185707 [Annulohypoxylon maeteangense]|uniref:uncharacterized protein n=1 Tax=Annulohypoxylon maeteangense TaxID=1927788 RepID=UPI002007B73C|nr:uncharacterized protein GGS22DRAFT_185707 [Annulohypoxylon maeteangense]KAI0888328.1 hypothetical protein GGS22DRAFT_185707 [Annulohypoxylon maeteangense]